MANSPDKIKATLGTVVVHLLLFVLLMFLALRTPLPLPEEEGVEVNLGYADQGRGQQQHQQPAPVAQPRPAPAVPAKVAAKPIEAVATQQSEEAPALPPKKDDKLKPAPIPDDMENEASAAEEVPEQAVPKPDSKPQPKPQPTIDPRLLYKGKANNAEGQSSEGNSQVAGDQGQANGTPQADSYQGAGGQGHGIRFSLGNRKAIKLPKPTYSSTDQGTVVVSIWVDKTGRVRRAAKLQKGTTVTDPALISMAVQAAKQASFTADSEAQAELQKGTITYVFRKLN